MLHFGPPAIAGVLALAFASCTALGFARGWVPAMTAIFRTRLVGPAAARVEDFLPHLVLLWAMVGAGAAYAAHRYGTERTRRLTRQYELRLRRGLSRFGLIACACLFLFSLARSWADGAAGVPERLYTGDQPSWQVAEGRYSALFGFLPWSDAHAYYVGARRLAEQGTLDDWNQRRPFNVALLAFRLGLTAFDLRAATVLQVLLLALCTFSASHALARGLGVWAGIGTTALILSFGRVYQPTTLTESLGISFGALSVSLLYRGIQDRNAAVAAGGLGAMSFAMGARAGAVFAIPCLLVGLFLLIRVFEASRRKAFTVALLAALLGVSWTPALNRLYGSTAGMAYSNFAFTTCGLAMGGSWNDAAQRYAAELASLSSEREKASFLYRQTFELVRRDPRPLIGVLLKNEWQFFRQIGPWLHGLAFFDLPRVALASGLQVLLLLVIVRHLFRGRIPGESMFWLAGWAGILLSVPFIRDGGWRTIAALDVPRNALASCLQVLLLLAIVRHLFRGRIPGESMFWLAGWAGILLSVPFIWDGGFRVHAASWPFVAAFVSTGLVIPGVVRSSKSRRSLWDGSRELAAGCLVLLAVGTLAGPWITHAALSAPLDLKGCPVDHEKNTFLIVRRTDLDLAVGVVDVGAPPMAGIPTVEFERYVRILNETGMEDSGTLLDAPARPFLLLCAYDPLAHWAYQLVAPTELRAGKSQRLWMRVEPWKESKYFFRVVDFGPWQPCEETHRAP
jgi:hypothetical protein